MKTLSPSTELSYYGSVAFRRGDAACRVCSGAPRLGRTVGAAAAAAAAAVEEAAGARVSGLEGQWGRDGCPQEGA
ncbi:Protein of unknown function [Gryllus bimaculatus]|nr:Protein of unknown function [Gryllus bimaculatus]